MIKCTQCPRILEENAFNWRNKAKGIRHKYCPECQNAKSKQHYKENKSRYLELTDTRSAKRRKDYQVKMLDLLRNKYCIDCGEDDPIVLDFDHVNGDKIKCVSTMAVTGYSWDSILKEIDKCEVRCANCHRRITAKRANSYKYAAASNGRGNCASNAAG
jgi:hypothetical protein